MKDLMIDIETLGTGSNAVMIQLSGVFFDPGTKKAGRVFDRCLGVDDSVAKGFEKDKSTEQWWKEQNQDIFNGIINRGEDCRTVMKDFLDFSICPIAGDPPRIWSHATFDFVIVNNYLSKLGFRKLDFRKAMDIRTLTYLSDLDTSCYDWDNKTHNALDDCLFQINYCSDAINIIKGNNVHI
jgi:hypothetical protein